MVIAEETIERGSFFCATGLIRHHKSCTLRGHDADNRLARIASREKRVKCCKLLRYSNDDRPQATNYTNLEEISRLQTGTSLQTVQNMLKQRLLLYTLHMKLMRGICGTKQIAFVIFSRGQGATRMMTYGEDRAGLILDLQRTSYTE